MSILTAGGGTGAQGDVVGVASTISGTGTTSVTITDAAVLGASAKVKFIATMLKTSVKQKNKTVKLMKNLKVVATDADGAYGTRSGDKDISLGRADVFKLVAVYDSEATDTDAVAPTLTLSNTSGTFIRGEEITGATSIATGRCIDISSPMSYSLVTGIFTTGEMLPLVLEQQFLLRQRGIKLSQEVIYLILVCEITSTTLLGLLENLPSLLQQEDFLLYMIIWNTAVVI